MKLSYNTGDRVKILQGNKYATVLIQLQGDKKLLVRIDHKYYTNEQFCDEISVKDCIIVGKSYIKPDPEQLKGTKRDVGINHK